MEARQISLLDFLTGNDRRFIIPVFQRNYDWKFKHCKQLFEDIEKLHINNNRKSHFLGTIVYVSNSEVDMIDFHEYVLIDGQQRITTTILLLKALYDKLEEMENNDKINMQLKQRIYEEYLVNKFAEESQKLRLKPMVDDDIVFKKIMQDDYELIDKTSNIYTNFEYLKNLIDKSRLSPKELFNSIKRLMIVYIGLKRGEDDPQLIFESLNSTGLNLSEADLIRNFILMDKEPNEQERLYKFYWRKIEQLLDDNEIISEFIRDYLTMKQNSIPKKSEVYNEFKKYVNNNLGLENIEKLLSDLVYYSKIYNKLINETEKNKEIRDILINFRRLKMTVAYPFLMEVYDDYYNEVIDTKTIVKIFKLIEIYAFRRLICDYASNALNKVFMTLGKDLKNIDDYKNNYYSSLASILMNKKYSSKFPIDSEFKQSFITRNMYKFKQAKYLLEHLENYDNNEKVDVDELSIEHIMPQKLDERWSLKLGDNAQDIHEKYLHNIGNLSLTGYNSNLSNKSFDEKKVILENSKLKLNKGLTKINTWNEDEIEKRAKELFNIANQIWPMPSSEEITIKDIDIMNKEYFNLSDEIDVTNRKPIAFEILGEKHNINSWRKLVKKVSKILYELEAKRFRKFVYDSDFSGRRTRIISNNKEMRKAFKIDDNLYIETNLNANSSLNYVKLIMEKLDMDDNDFKYWIK